MEIGPLTQFGDWLVSTGRSVTTAGLYRTSVAAALRQMTSVDDVETLRTYTAGLARSTRKVFLASWRAFQSYMVANKGPELPDATAPVADLPEAIAIALYTLQEKAEIPATVLGRLRWGHVAKAPNGQYRVVRPGGKPGEGYLCVGPARDAILILRDWSDRGAGDRQPVVPEHPGSEVCYPAKRLYAEIRKMREERPNAQSRVSQPSVALGVESEDATASPPAIDPTVPPPWDPADVPVDSGPPPEDED